MLHCPYCGSVDCGGCDIRLTQVVNLSYGLVDPEESEDYRGGGRRCLP